MSFILVTALFAGALLAGEEKQPPAVAYRAGRVIPVTGGELAPGTVVVRGGRIEKVLGGGDAVPGGIEVVDLGDAAVIVPALINPLSMVHTLGDASRGQRPGMISGGEGGTSDQRGRKASDLLSPREEIFRRLGRTGYGAIALVPSAANFISGRAAVIHPGTAEKKEELLLVDDGYLYLGYGLGKPWKDLAERELKKAAEEARRIRTGGKTAGEKGKDDGEAAGKDRGRPGAKDQPPPAPEKAAPEAAGKKAEGADSRPEPPRPPDPLVEVFLGQRRAWLDARAPAVLDHLFRVLDGLPEPLSFILVTQPQEPAMVEKIARRRDRIQGVILEPELDTFSDTSVLFNGARLFSDAGIPVAFVPASDDLAGHADVFFHLSGIAQAGLRREKILDAVTINPARFLGIDDRLGSLAPGKVASFSVYNGDPLSGSARLLRVLIEGKQVFSDDPSTGAVAGEALK